MFPLVSFQRILQFAHQEGVRWRLKSAHITHWRRLRVLLFNRHIPEDNKVSIHNTSGQITFEFFKHKHSWKPELEHVPVYWICLDFICAVCQRDFPWCWCRCVKVHGQGFCLKRTSEMLFSWDVCSSYLNRCACWVDLRSGLGGCLPEYHCGLIFTYENLVPILSLVFVSAMWSVYYLMIRWQFSVIIHSYVCILIQTFKKNAF